MSGWYKPKEITGTFEELGHPEFSFAAVDINSLLYGELEKLMELRDRVEGDTVSSELIQALMERLVISWNLTDPETGTPLAPPKEDSTSFRRLPMSFINHMITTIMGVAGEEPVPPESGS